MDKNFAIRVLQTLEAKNKDNPDFGRFMSDFNQRSGEEQIGIINDVAGKMGMKFEPDEVAPQTGSDLANRGRAFTMGAAKSATFGLAKPLAKAVGTVVSPDSAEMVGKQIEADEKFLSTDYKWSYRIGRGVGYLVNPVATAIKAGTGLFGLATTAAQQAAVVEGGINVLEEGEKWRSGEIDAKEFSKNVAVKTSGDVVGAYAGALALGGIAKGLFAGGKALVDKYTSAIDDWLTPQAKLLAAKSKEVAALPKKEAAEQFEPLGKEVLNYYNTLKETVYNGMKKDAAALTDDVIDLSKGFDDLLNRQAAEATKIIAGQSPKTLISNLKQTESTLRFMYENITKNYGDELNRIASDVGDTSVTFNGVRAALTSALDDPAFQAANPGATKRIAAVLEKFFTEDLTFKQADVLRREIDDIIPFNGNLHGFKQLLEARNIISSKLKDPAAFGETAVRYNELQQTYSSLFDTRRNLMNAATKVEEGMVNPATITEKLKSLENVLAKAFIPAKKGGKVTGFSPEHQKLFDETLADMRKTIEVKAAVKFAKGKGVLKNLIASDEPIEDTTVKMFKEAYEGLYGSDMLARMKAAKKLPNAVQDAIENPLNVEARNAAFAYLDDVAPNARANLKALLDRAAHVHRIQGNKFYTEIEPFAEDLVAGNIATPAQIKELQLVSDLSPEFSKLVDKFLTAKAARDYSSLIDPDRAGTLKGTGLDLLASKLNRLFTVINLAKDPTGVQLLMNKLDLPQSTAKQLVKEITKVTALSRVVESEEK